MPDESVKKEEETGWRMAAGQTSSRPFFLGWALQRFKEVERMDDNKLAEFLNVEPGKLTRLSLCRRPDPSNPVSFRQDVLRIADRFELAASSLANLLHRAEAYQAARTTPPSNIRLLAARDYSPAEEEKPEDA